MIACDPITVAGAALFLIVGGLLGVGLLALAVGWLALRTRADVLRVEALQGRLPSKPDDRDAGGAP